MDVKQKSGGYVIIDAGDVSAEEITRLDFIDPIVLDTAHRLGKPLRVRLRVVLQDVMITLYPQAIGEVIRAFTGLTPLLDVICMITFLKTDEGWQCCVTPFNVEQGG